MLRCQVATYHYLLFDGQTKLVDGEDYETCCFRNCTLVYQGGEPPQFRNCSFVACRWLLGRVRVNEIRFMSVQLLNEADELIDRLLCAIQHLPAQSDSVAQVWTRDRTRSVH